MVARKRVTFLSRKSNSGSRLRGVRGDLGGIRPISAVWGAYLARTDGVGVAEKPRPAGIGLVIVAGLASPLAESAFARPVAPRDRRGVKSAVMVILRNK